MDFKFSYAFSYADCAIYAAINIGNEVIPGDHMDEGERPFPNGVVLVAVVNRWAFAIEGILLDDGEKVGSIEECATASATVLFCYHIFARAGRVGKDDGQQGVCF